MTSQVQSPQKEGDTRLNSQVQRSKTTYTAVYTNKLERFRGLVVKKHGYLKGALMFEISRAMTNHMHTLSLEAEQHHQKEIACRVRSDVMANLNQIQRKLYNDRGPYGKISGEDLWCLIRTITGCKDNRTARTYLGRLYDEKKLIVRQKGRGMFTTNTIYEII